MRNVSPLRVVGIIFTLGFGTIAGLLSTVYLFTNARLLFSGDYSIYSLPVLGFFDTFFSFVAYTAIVGFIVVSYLYILKKGFMSQKVYSILAIGFFAMSLMYIAMNKLWPSNGIEGILVFINKMSLLGVSIGVLIQLISD